jgi:hypothetical protein
MPQNKSFQFDRLAVHGGEGLLPPMGQKMQSILTIIAGLPYKLIQHFGFVFFACPSLLGSKPFGQCFFHVQW